MKQLGSNSYKDPLIDNGVQDPIRSRTLVLRSNLASWIPGQLFHLKFSFLLTWVTLLFRSSFVPVDCNFSPFSHFIRRNFHKTWAAHSIAHWFFNWVSILFYFHYFSKFCNEGKVDFWGGRTVEEEKSILQSLHL